MCYYENIIDEKRDLDPLLKSKKEFEFLINTPIAGITIASLPQNSTENTINNEINVDDVNNENQTENNNNSNDGTETVTNVEDLFN